MNESLEEHLTEMTSAVRAIAHGGVGGPGGLEALAMAVSGSGFEINLSNAVLSAGDGIAESIDDLAEAINGLARAVSSIRGAQASE